MGEYLPGNLQERLRKLREFNGFKSREILFEEILFISRKKGEK